MRSIGTVEAGPAQPATRRTADPARRWWREVLIGAVFYGAYTAARDLQGSIGTSGARAVANAYRVVDIERAIGIYHELAVQHAALSATWLIRIFNAFYGSLHFLVTGAILVWLYRREPELYRRGRSALAFTTALALVGFTLYPMAPPRLMPDSFGFVDTLARFPTLWSFDSGAAARLSDQYAAMPSLHFAWALWCTAAAWPALSRRRSRAAMLAYPSVTLIVVVATANHFFLDVVMGALTLAAGFALTRLAARGSVRERDTDHEVRSARAIGEVHGAAVRGHRVVHDREAEARAAAAPAPCVVHPHEAVEHPAAVRFGNPRTVVDDLEDR